VQISSSSSGLLHLYSYNLYGDLELLDFYKCSALPASLSLRLGHVVTSICLEKYFKSAPNQKQRTRQINYLCKRPQPKMLLLHPANVSQLRDVTASVLLIRDKNHQASTLATKSSISTIVASDARLLCSPFTRGRIAHCTPSVRLSVHRSVTSDFVAKCSYCRRYLT